MPGKVDSGEIVNLSLMPIGGMPNIGNRRHLWKAPLLIVFPSRQNHLENQARLMRDAPEMINHLRAWLSDQLCNLFRIGLIVINTADAGEIIKL
jgi:hypothetical protein